MVNRIALTFALVLLTSLPALAGPTLYSAPLRVDDDHEIVCRIRNVSNKEVIVQIAIVRVFDNVEVAVGSEETLQPGHGTARGQLQSASSAGCEFRMIKGSRKSVRASASIQGPSPNRSTIAAIEAY